VEDSDQQGARSLLRLLEDYVQVGQDPLIALVPRHTSTAFIDGVRAAALSAQMGIGIGYALERYVDEGAGVSVPAALDAFQEAYSVGKRHIHATAARLQPSETPTAGETYADVALRRLQPTYFAAGLLFKVGHLVEAHTLSRLFLEQVAWAYGVFEFQTRQAAARLSPPRAISLFGELIPSVGPLYGELSEDAHLDLEEHLRFLRFNDGSAEILLAPGRASLLAGAVLLDLADFWSVAYERSQWPHILAPENWTDSPQGPELRLDRPFLDVASQVRRRLVESVASS